MKKAMLFRNGKLVERRGRKAAGPRNTSGVLGSRAAEKSIVAFFFEFNKNTEQRKERVK